MKHYSSYFSLMLLIGAVAAMSSCSTYSYTSRTQIVNGGRIAETNKVADVEADFTRQISVVGDWAMSSSAAKASAEYKAIKENQIDVLVDPIYKITVAPVFNTTDGAPWYTMSYRAEVTGYAGTYKKLLSQEEQIKQLEEVDKADIEKFKLLNEPDFYKYYYNTKQGDVKGNVFVGGFSSLPDFDTEVQPAGLPVLKDVAPQKEVKPIDEKQVRNLILTGKTFVGIGVTAAAAGVICASVGGYYWDKYENASKYGNYSYSYYSSNSYYMQAEEKCRQGSQLVVAGASLIGVGGGLFAAIIGGSCWGVGEKKLKTASGDFALQYNVSSTGVNLAFKF